MITVQKSVVYLSSLSTAVVLVTSFSKEYSFIFVVVPIHMCMNIIGFFEAGSKIGD